MCEYVGGEQRIFPSYAYLQFLATSFIRLNSISNIIRMVTEFSVIVIYGLIVHRVGTSGRNAQRTNLEMVNLYP